MSPHCTLTEASLPEQGTGKPTLLDPSREIELAESEIAETQTVSADAAPATASTDIIEASKP